jgi:predicted nuclease of predicted toxin-antitoxin system
MRTATDAAQLAYARSTGRVLVTHDVDFLRLASASTDHAGIAYCRQNKRSLGEVVRMLVLLYELMTPDDMVGQVEYL